MLMWLRMAPALHLIFLLIIHRVSAAGWGVNYSPSHICALQNSTMTISCTFTYPTPGYQIVKVFWIKDLVNDDKYPDLSVDPEYSQRLQYLGDKQQICTVRLSHVTKKDEGLYYFRFITNVTGGMWTGTPGVGLSVTDLQLESPERVTERDSVRLTCNSSCKLTDTPTFIWYRNSHTLTERSSELLLQSVRRQDAGRYRCAVDGHTLTSPEVYLNVTYPPKSILVSISGSAVIMSGDSVTLSCSSDSNPPAEISWFKGKKYLNSGRIFRIPKISSDDSGEYKCRARNEHGVKYSDPVTLDVQYPPRNISVSISGSAVIMSGDSVTLNCSSDSNPPAEISWFKGETSVGSGRIFSISKISSDDSGEYNCSASNKHGEKYSDPVTLDVQCDWYKGDTSVGSGRLYSISKISSGDSGEYKCRARNDHGEKYSDPAPHGAQRSDAVTVTGEAFIVTLLKKQRSAKSEGLTVTQNGLYSDPGSVVDALYASVNPKKGRAAESNDAEEIQYATVQFHRDTQMKREYDNTPVQQPDQDHSQSKAERVEDSVIYSSVR
nr:B-cell receptor CD22-like [Danio rerio]|eukprot:XP_021333812.1 B-cell receptor CD22-like [Danio rerio]